MNFTLTSALLGTLGGALIGLAAVFIMATNGRIAGISGIVAGIVSPQRGEFAWRVAFVAGLVIGGLGYALAFGGLPIYPDVSWPVLALAGLLVGYGTRLGGGCTSGHGVCGIARGRGRSIVATCLFMATAVVTVWLTRHVLGG